MWRECRGWCKGINTRLFGGAPIVNGLMYFMTKTCALFLKKYLLALFYLEQLSDTRQNRVLKQYFSWLPDLLK